MSKQSEAAEPQYSQVHRLIIGDALTVLKSLADESVDLCVTSSPYYGLRDYGANCSTVWGGVETCEHQWESTDGIRKSWGSTSILEDQKQGTIRGSLSNVSALTSKSNFCSKCGAWKGQLGLEPTFQMFIDHLLLIFKEVKRVLKSTGSLYFNIGDSYSGNGCEVSQQCYAKRTAKRFKQRCNLCYEFKPHYHLERFDQPLKVKKPSGIFTGSMSDLFDDRFGWGMTAPIINRMWDAPQHRFYLLTKQPQNAVNYGEYPPNVWFGVTVNRWSDMWRLDHLRRIEAKVKFVSFEPLYEDLGEINLTGIDWIIIGGQTKPTLKPKDEWVLNVIRQKVEGTPVFLKNNLEWPHNIQQFPEERV